MYSFSKKSSEALSTCAGDLQLIMNRAIELSNIDFGISQGYRSPEMQNRYFELGLSRIDGITKKGKHNELPSMAADIYAYVNGKASYSERDLCYIAGVITSTAYSMKYNGEIDHDIRWGGNWDGDGVIVTDQSFIDMPHFELV